MIPPSFRCLDISILKRSVIKKYYLSDFKKSEPRSSLKAANDLNVHFWAVLPLEGYDPKYGN